MKIFSAGAVSVVFMNAERPVRGNDQEETDGGTTADG